jgi:hypothetical protein
LPEAGQRIGKSLHRENSAKMSRTDGACPAAHLETDGCDALAESRSDPSRIRNRLADSCFTAYSAAKRSLRPSC